MSLFLERKFGSFIDQLEKQLTECEDPLELAMIHSNIAAAQYELGLFRKCIKTCQNALDLSPSFMRASIIKGKALVASGKISDALDTWKQASSCSITCDVYLLKEVLGLIEEHTEKTKNTNVSNEMDSPKVENPPPLKLSQPEAVEPVITKVVSPQSANPICAVGSVENSPISPVKEEGDMLARKPLRAFHAKHIGSGSNPIIKPIFLNAMRENLPSISHDELVDDIICFGYINVNTGNHELALAAFKLLLEYRQDLPSVFIGIGSIHAMQRDLDTAIAEFTSAINLDSSIADAWKRRGQTRAAKGSLKSSIKDLSRALALQHDADTYNQRAMVFHQSKNYVRALTDFKTALREGMNTAALHNYIGMCEGQIGNVFTSIEHHRKAIELDPKLREAYLNIAIMYKEYGNCVPAFDYLKQATNVETRAFYQVYVHRATLWYMLGRSGAALRDTIIGLTAIKEITNTALRTGQPSELSEVRHNEEIMNCLLRATSCYQSNGQYAKAIDFFDQVLSFDTTHNCWFRRELTLCLWYLLDTDLRSYSIDDKVDARLKDGWCKHATNYKEYLMRIQREENLPTYVVLKNPKNIKPVEQINEDDSADRGNTVIPAVIPLIANFDKKQRLIEAIRPFREWIQLDCPGFLPNRRQHRMFGMSALQIARALCSHVQLIQLEGVGLEVPDVSSSRARNSANRASIPSASTGLVNNKKAGKKASPVSPATLSSSSAGGISSTVFSSATGKRGGGAMHTLGWRDLFDIAVRWRQISDLNDAVWWIDRFPNKSFNEGFGLETPIVNGQLRTIRYYSYFPAAFSILKNLLSEGYYGSNDQYEQFDSAKQSALATAATLQDIYALVGKSFYVVVPCRSMRKPEQVMDGTRLTLIQRDPEGFEFTIRTPSKPYRWGLYDEELESCFRRLEDALLAGSAVAATGTAAAPATPTGTKNIVPPPPPPASVAESVSSSRSRNAGTAAGDDEDSPSQDDSSKPSAADAPPSAPLAALTPAQRTQLVLTRALELFYYWVTMAPLSRGTAACGYSAIMGVMLAHGKIIIDKLPTGKQLDWEAILARDCASFVATVIGWFKLADYSKPADILGGASESILSCIETLRDMHEILAFPYPDYHN